MKDQKNKTPNLYEPPGGMLIWIIISIELLTFIIGIAVFLYRRQGAYELFAQSQALLDKGLGTINTMVLISGGFFMAQSLQQLKNGQAFKSLRNIRLASLMGFVFLLIKGYEYYDKILHRHTLEANDFFTFYWLLTGFHFIHVLVALIILLFLARGIRKGAYNQHQYEDVETGGAFWHMCDLIWLLLFPVLYLLP